MNKKKRNTLFVYFKISISDLRNKFPEIETLVNSGNPVYLTKNGYGANSLGGGFCICDKCLYKQQEACWFMLPYEAEDYAENLISQVRKKDEKIAQRDFDMAKMVDFLT